MTTVPALDAECRRIEENADHASQSLFTSSGIWSHVHQALVIPAAVLAFLAAAATTSSDFASSVGWLAMLSGALASLSVAIGPSDKAREHKAAGEAYLTLRNRARQVRTIDVVDPAISGARKSDAVRQLEIERAGVATWAPEPGWFGLAFRLGERNISKGRTRNVVDSDGHEPQ